MKKSTIFFSHSSKDSKVVNYLKDLIQEKTGSMLDVFLSSDGQSIPFGTNWVHKIEQGLDESIIMFVFITPSSIKSNWIYFESGFAYSKKVKVIPIGIGITISDLKPPLNLLQGFNLSSKEGINNIIKIINDECKTTFKENASDKEFSTLLSLMGFDVVNNELLKVIDYFETRIFPYTSFETKEKINIDTDKSFEFIRNELTSNKSKYADLDTQIIFNGLKVEVVKQKHDKYQKEIKFKVSSDCLDQHFDIIKKALNSAYGKKEKHYLKINLDKSYDIVTDELKLSSIINRIGSMTFLDNSKNLGFNFKKLSFFIDDVENKSQKQEHENINSSLRIIFNESSTCEEIFNLLSLLLESKIIYKVK
ncbi:toll/interleukin-1 receptor domain-containing protein [Senegalia sp. (in: firmicutes)]|uniref:toll/interleukin-1 receptor domain-containing protein n=1 Tax=Senegalia sp. (in: firmicutes) TaxID=1924098 RepID=UPI003F9A4D8D